jgi:hypothetical protein
LDRPICKADGTIGRVRASSREPDKPGRGPYGILAFATVYAESATPRAVIIDYRAEVQQDAGSVGAWRLFTLAQTQSHDALADSTTGVGQKFAFEVGLSLGYGGPIVWGALSGRPARTAPSTGLHSIIGNHTTHAVQCSTCEKKGIRLSCRYTDRTCTRTQERPYVRNVTVEKKPYYYA